MVASSRLSRIAQWGRAWVDEVFGADLRSLAALRIVLAIVVLADLAGRAANLTVHYTDGGVLPRRAALRELNEWQISLNLINGTSFVQGILFGITALAAVALLVGFRTRQAMIVVWLMMMSIQWRNPLVLSDADTLLRVLLFWAMFLPLGAQWSVDRASSVVPIRSSQRFLSVATAAILFQIAFMYWFSVILKTGDEWREDGTALYYALSAQHLTTPFGDYLRQFPELLKVLTFGTVGVEAIAPILLFSPVLTKWARMTAIISLMSLHAGILLTMNIGFFPWLSAFCMVGFLPSAFWEATVPRARAAFPELFALGGRVRRSAGRVANLMPSPVRSRQGAMAGAGSNVDTGLLSHAMVDHRPGQGGHSRSTLPALLPLPPGAPATNVRPSLVVNLVALALLVYVFFWNVSTVSAFAMPEPVRPLGNLLGLKQSWNMFAPRPSTATTWYVIPGTLEDGRQIDLLPLVVHDDPTKVTDVSWLHPRDFDAVFGDKYWRKYLGAIRTESDQRSYLAQYVCRTWNSTHTGSDALVSLQVVYVRERSLPDQLRSAPKPDVLSSHTCA